jgi:hypothetical protein
MSFIIHYLSGKLKAVLWCEGLFSPRVLGPAVTLHSIPGMTLVCFQSF